MATVSNHPKVEINHVVYDLLQTTGTVGGMINISISSRNLQQRQDEVQVLCVLIVVTGGEAKLLLSDGLVAP